VSSLVIEQLHTEALELRYHLVPWDRPSLPGGSASIATIEVHHPDQARLDFEAFGRWCSEHEVCLVTCRLPQHRLVESGFLESVGFRFVELNYRPRCTGLGEVCADPAMTVETASAADEAEVTAIAGATFQSGRFYLDPQLGPAISHRRFAGWVAGAFCNPQQRVLVCRMEGQIIGFLVDEHLGVEQRTWSLTGLVPDRRGLGLGRRMFESILAYNQAEGIREVVTSISSQNVVIFNLLASLGFRFPAPQSTFHWCPRGPLQ
jgi:GNAT superfamily N-acetyltransferase